MSTESLVMVGEAPPVCAEIDYLMGNPQKKTSGSSMRFHAYSLWLFTLSDLKTIVGPQTLFGVCNALALYANTEASGEGSNMVQLFLQAPSAVFWVWINLLPFAIDNQRQEVAILEDRHNKPWRTMPSGRMTQKQAKALMCCLYPVACCASVCLGGLRQCLTLMVLGYFYNDLGLADWNWVSRNAINALGFCCFASGALEVTLKLPLTGEHRHVIKWLGIIAAVVFSTVQIQDMADQEGDRLRDRKSLPLAVGDGPARYLIAVLVLFWSVLCPLHWMVSNGAFLGVLGLGLGIAYRTLVLRSVAADKTTFRLWNAWMAALYTLPLVAAVGL